MMEERAPFQEIEVPGFQGGLMRTLYELWHQGQLCDAVIHTANGSIEAHRALLCAASPYLHSIEVSNLQQQRVSHYHLPMTRLEDITILLQLFYTGRFTVSSQNVEEIMQLCMFLKIGEAVQLCQMFINGWLPNKQQADVNLHENLFSHQDKLGVSDGLLKGNVPVGISISEYTHHVSNTGGSLQDNFSQNQLNMHPEQNFVIGERSQGEVTSMVTRIEMCASKENHTNGAFHEVQQSMGTSSPKLTVLRDAQRRSHINEGLETRVSLGGSGPRRIPDDHVEDAEGIPSSLSSGDADNLSNPSSIDTHECVNSVTSNNEKVIDNDTGHSQTSTNTDGPCLNIEESDTSTLHKNSYDSDDQSRDTLPNYNLHCHSKSSTLSTSKYGLIYENEEKGYVVGKEDVEKNPDSIVQINDDRNVEKVNDKKKAVRSFSLRSDSTTKPVVEITKRKCAKKRKLELSGDKKKQKVSEPNRHKTRLLIKSREIVTRTKIKKDGKASKDKDQTIWTCAFCKLVFKSKWERAKHRYQVHKPESYKCVVCKAIFSTPSELKGHKEHAHPERIRCLKCEDRPTFSTISELENHRKNQHVRDQTIRCRICREIFETKEAKNDHVKKVHPSGKNCPECNTKFENWKHLVDHRNHKHNIPFEANKYEIFNCDNENCDYQTVDKYRFVCHKRDVHCGDRTHTCHTCNSTFKSQRALKSHQEVHLDREQRNGSQCDQCGKKFLSVAYLKTHIDTMHSTEKKTIKKQYLCHLCPNSFRDKHFFHSHMLRAHDVAPPADLKLHRCTHCDFFTVQKSHLRKHMRHHSAGAKEYECNTCGKKFLTEDCLGRHIQRHQMKDECCPIPGCGYSTKYKNNLKNHIARIHTQKDLKPFLCPYCEYRCKEKGNLNKHITGKHKMEVVTVAKLRKNAIKTGTGYPNFVTSSHSNAAAAYSDEENLGTQMNLETNVLSSCHQYPMDYGMQVYNGTM